MITKYYTLCSLGKRNVFSHSSGSWKSLGKHGWWRLLRIALCTLVQNSMRICVWEIHAYFLKSVTMDKTVSNAIIFDEYLMNEHYWLCRYQCILFCWFKKSRKQRSRCWEGWFPLRPLSSVCRWPCETVSLPGLFSVCVHPWCLFLFG